MNYLRTQYITMQYICLILDAISRCSKTAKQRRPIGIYRIFTREQSYSESNGEQKPNRNASLLGIGIGLAYNYICVS
jgi:hypothetical protein